MKVSSTVREAFRHGARITHLADVEEQFITVGPDRRVWRLTDSEWTEVTAVVRRAFQVLVPGPSLDDARQARMTAIAWHGGQSSALYAFASTGSILSDLDDEIADALDLSDSCRSDMIAWEEYPGQGSAQHAHERQQLNRLRRFVAFHGPRGPQDGWSQLGP